MSIRLRTLILIAGTTAALLALLYAVSAFVFLDRFARLENREALRSLEQARNALSGELDELAVFNHDWAAWDDTYSFIQDGNLAFVEANLMDETFVGAGLDLMLFLDRAGRVVFGRSYDRQQNTTLPVPAEVLRNLGPGSRLVPQTDRDESFGGVLLLSQAPLLVSSRPILTSTFQGPSRGTLIMGRYLDERKVAELAEQTRLELRLFRLDRDALQELPEQARAQLALQGALVRPLDEQRIAAYALLPDVFGGAALVLRSVIPREIHRQGRMSIRDLALSLVGVALFFGALTMVLLEVAVLRRLSGLSRSVTQIGSRRDLADRVAVQGKDELAVLAAAINSMLAELQKSVETHQALTRAVPDLILRVGRSGAILDANRPEDPLLEPVEPSAEPGGLGRRLPAALAQASQRQLRAAMASGRMRIFEHRQQGPGGFRDYEARILALAPGEALQIIRDVTERKQAEELAKKELLLREIHHRVKNNLQVVSSLLYLQSQQVGDPRLAEILEENRHRIRSIALIHEKLYQSSGSGEVRFAAYLRDLTNNLLIAYGASVSRVRLELEVDEGEALDLDTSILLGLLITELVSNALKHAFPQGAGGLIRIALERAGQEGLRLEVADDGVGLPVECDPAAPRSMGLLLVQLFAKQLEADLEVQREGGTRFLLRLRSRD
jgi:two-component sensor histidine kinase/sensor domain CHASE-containing protein